MTDHTSPDRRGAHIDALLAAARDDTAPVGADLRARILAQAPGAAKGGPRRRPLDARIGGWLGGLVAMPGAALLGLWAGLAQPAAVLELMPRSGSLASFVADETTTGAEAELLGEVFGTVWADETLEETQ